MHDDNLKIKIQNAGQLTEQLRKCGAQTVLQRIADGDQNAVQECVNSYGGLVWSLAKRMLRNQDDAEDAVQQIFVDIWKNAAKFDPAQASETTFVAMIARRGLIDKIRFMQRRISADSLQDLVNEPAGSSKKELHVQIEGREAFKELNELRLDQRQVLQLSIIHGLSHQEIADATGMPIVNVKSHARRGLLQARELLGFGGTGLIRPVEQKCSAAVRSIMNISKTVVGEFSLRRLVTSLLLIPVVVYLGFLIVSLLAVDRVIFQPQRYYSSPQAVQTILFSHGNAEDFGTNDTSLQDLRDNRFTGLPM